MKNFILLLAFISIAVYIDSDKKVETDEDVRTRFEILKEQCFKEANTNQYINCNRFKAKTPSY